MKEIMLTILGVIVFILIVIAILFHKSISQFKKILKQAAEAREARRTRYRGDRRVPCRD